MATVITCIAIHGSITRIHLCYKNVHRKKNSKTSKETTCYNANATIKVTKCGKLHTLYTVSILQNLLPICFVQLQFQFYLDQVISHTAHAYMQKSRIEYWVALS